MGVKTGVKMGRNENPHLYPRHGKTSPRGQRAPELPWTDIIRYALGVWGGHQHASVFASARISRFCGENAPRLVEEYVLPRMRGEVEYAPPRMLTSAENGCGTSVFLDHQFAVQSVFDWW